VVVPSPTAPVELAPQHHSVPSLFRAHVCAQPATIPVLFVPAALTSTGDGFGAGAVVPSPSWPESLRPQHHSVPSPLRAQVYDSPVATSTTLLPRIVICTGESLGGDGAPSPSWLEALCPQHQRLPSSFRAQV
jgi:hypothetical protein